MGKRGKNQTTTERLFSNGTQHMIWDTNNCEKCWRQNRGKSFNTFKCSIDRDIQSQMFGVLEISPRSLKIVRSGNCQFKAEKKPNYWRPKKRKPVGDLFNDKLLTGGE